MYDLIEVISTVGFPMALCVYLLYERNQAIKELRGVISDLHILIAEKL